MNIQNMEVTIRTDTTYEMFKYDSTKGFHGNYAYTNNDGEMWLGRYRRNKCHGMWHYFHKDGIHSSYKYKNNTMSMSVHYLEHGATHTRWY